MDFFVVYFYNGLHILISNSTVVVFSFPKEYLFICLHRVLIVACRI